MMVGYAFRTDQCPCKKQEPVRQRKEKKLTGMEFEEDDTSEHC